MKYIDYDTNRQHMHKYTTQGTGSDGRDFEPPGEWDINAPYFFTSVYGYFNETGP